MREALHIFRKDTRHLRVAIGAVVGWTALFAIVWSTTDLLRTQDVPPLGNLTYALTGVSHFVFPALWAYLVSQVVHAEALPGDRQFWLTRPYHRGSLVAAKALFVLAYLSGPLFLAQLTILLSHGFPLHAIIPGLLWTQVIMIGVVVLPAAALATLTVSLPQFVLWSIFAPVCAVVVAGLGSWGALEWVRLTGAGGVVALVSAGVVALQYARRRTSTARVAGLAGVLLALVTAALLPWEFAFAVQRRLAPESGLAVTARIERPPLRTATASARVWRPLHAWVALDGVPDGTPLRCEGAAVAITAASASRPAWTSPIGHYGGTGLRRDGGCQVAVSIPSDVRADFGEMPVTIRATVYVTMFGAPDTTTVARQSARWIPSVGLCRSDAAVATRVTGGRVERTPATAVTCLAPFRRPSSIVEISGTGTGSRTTSTRLSFSPFPASFGFTPDVVLSEMFFGPTDLSIHAREPIAHVERTVELSNVHIPDFDVAIGPGDTRQ